MLEVFVAARKTQRASAREVEGIHVVLRAALGRLDKLECAHGKRRVEGVVELWEQVRQLQGQVAAMRAASHAATSPAVQGQEVLFSSVSGDVAKVLLITDSIMQRLERVFHEYGAGHWTVTVNKGQEALKIRHTPEQLEFYDLIVYVSAGNGVCFPPGKPAWQELMW